MRVAYCRFILRCYEKALGHPNLNGDFHQVTIQVGHDTFVIAIAGGARLAPHGVARRAQALGEGAHGRGAARGEGQVRVALAGSGPGRRQRGLLHQLQARPAGKREKVGGKLAFL